MKENSNFNMQAYGQASWRPRIIKRWQPESNTDEYNWGWKISCKYHI